jgi:hypothetical protein
VLDQSSVQEERVGSARVLKPGLNVSHWPDLKLARAEQHLSDLQARINIASTATPALLQPVFSVDRRTVTFTVGDRSGPLYEEWALVIGDFIHNVRAALDALAWDLAHLDGAVPSSSAEKRIYFPICQTEKAWISQLKGPLSTVPRDMQKRLYVLQPFVYERPSQAIFAVLNDLDILDKHRGLLHATARIRDPHYYATGITYEDDIDRSEVHEEFEWVAGPDAAPRAGQGLFSITSDKRMVSAESHMPLPIKLTIGPPENEHELWETLDLIGYQVEGTINMIYEGRFPDVSPAALEARGMTQETLERWSVRLADYQTKSAGLT